VACLAQLLSTKQVEDHAQMALVSGNLPDGFWPIVYDQFAPGTISVLKENMAKATLLRIFPFLGPGFEHDSQSNIQRGLYIRYAAAFTGR
jgi:hypothetical protein